MILLSLEGFMQEKGRSMVEMLGVLAIIGVLSVGAMNGYAKAMEKYKLNRYVNTYVHFFNDLLTYRDQLISHDSVKQTQLNELIYKLKLADDFDYAANSYFYDNLSGFFTVYTRSSTIVVDYHLEGTDSFNTTACENMVYQVLKPMYATILSVGLYRSTDGFGDLSFKGAAKCTAGANCLHDMSFSQAENFCSQCVEEKLCVVSINL